MLITFEITYTARILLFLLRENWFEGHFIGKTHESHLNYIINALNFILMPCKTNIILRTSPSLSDLHI